MKWLVVFLLTMTLMGCVEETYQPPPDNSPFFEREGSLTVEELGAVFKRGCLDVYPDFDGHRRAFRKLGFGPDVGYPERDWPFEDLYGQTSVLETRWNRRTRVKATYGTSDGTVHVPSETFCEVEALVKKPEDVSEESVMQFLPLGGKVDPKFRGGVWIKYADLDYGTRVIVDFPESQSLTWDSPLDVCKGLQKCRIRETMSFSIRR